MSVGLTNDALSHVYSFLSYDELCNARLVCKNWDQVNQTFRRRIRESRDEDRITYDQLWRNSFAKIEEIDHETFQKIHRIYLENNPRADRREGWRPDRTIGFLNYFGLPNAFPFVLTFNERLNSIDTQSNQNALRANLAPPVDNWQYDAIYLAAFGDKIIGVARSQTDEQNTLIALWNRADGALVWHFYKNIEIDQCYLYLLNQHGFPAFYFCHESQNVFLVLDPKNGEIICEHQIDTGSVSLPLSIYQYPLVDIGNAFLIAHFEEESFFVVGELTNDQKIAAERPLPKKSLFAKVRNCCLDSLRQFFSINMVRRCAHFIIKIADMLLTGVQNIFRRILSVCKKC